MYEKKTGNFVLIDELAVSLKSENGVKKLIGLVDLGKEHDLMRSLTTGKGSFIY